MTTSANLMRRRQVLTLARHEVGRSLFSRRSLAVYLLVGMPLALMLLRALFMPGSMRADATHATTE
ncbi:MAG: hypothetical protein OQK55_07735, partial [Thermoanaerobaculales bacterium]|nr:hypothetical protein [Thermoanaerobaculales bacterium]